MNGQEAETVKNCPRCGGEERVSEKKRGSGRAQCVIVLVLQGGRVKFESPASV